MYIVAGVLYLLPCSILFVAVKHATANRQELACPEWRDYCTQGALVVASIATVTAMLSMFSWLHSGGSPHGLAPVPGLWKTLRPLLKWTFVTSVALTIFGKGKVRLLLLGWVPAVVFVDYAVVMLNMD